ncbi:hypothetical protein AKJ09_04378 [Labilithrix luteola]|uniref:DUF1648 domain-containing protein n=1 Tax=Labilithrix luteola TaxID=1391654 RepID=A0A0K1PX66_9BACT|nr:hypothetical protein AKJ09_04378 [Labilithrix luteola]
MAIGLLSGTVLVTAALYTRLPELIPTHFDARGVANGWMHRSLGAWMLPSIAVVSWVIIRLGARVLPSDWKERLAASPTAVMGALTVGLLCSLQAVILYAALEHPPNVGASLGFVLGAFWCAIGLMMPKMRRNPWIGIRTAWTLSSDENWARTHRFAGYAFILGGLVAIIAAGLGCTPLAVAAIIVSSLVATIYSFILARRLPPSA